MTMAFWAQALHQKCAWHKQVHDQKYDMYIEHNLKLT